MARLKRHSGDQELSFVALMDTMTNVVGVLTIVLVLVGISLSRAASRILSNLPPATEAQVRDVQAAVDRLRSAQNILQQKLDTQPKPPSETAARLEADLAKLERDAQATPGKLLDLEDLRRELVRLAAELKEKKKAAEQLLVERDRIKALLDKTPVATAAPAKIVRIPISRPIPKDAKVEHIWVMKDDAYRIETDAIKQSFVDSFKNYSTLVDSRVRRGKMLVPIFDYEKLALYCKKQQYRFLDLNYSVGFVNWTSSPVLKLVPQSPPREPLQATLRRIKYAPNSVVMFHVNTDAFDKYLAVRDVCDQTGVPAGWECNTTPDYQILVREVETNKPKPPPATAPAVPAGPSIKSPAQSLD